MNQIRLTILKVFGCSVLMAALLFVCKSNFVYADCFVTSSLDPFYIGHFTLDTSSYPYSIVDNPNYLYFKDIPSTSFYILNTSSDNLTFISYSGAPYAPFSLTLSPGESHYLTPSHTYSLFLPIGLSINTSNYFPTSTPTPTPTPVGYSLPSPTKAPDFPSENWQPDYRYNGKKLEFAPGYAIYKFKRDIRCSVSISWHDNSLESDSTKQLRYKTESSSELLPYFVSQTLFQDEDFSFSLPSNVNYYYTVSIPPGFTVEYDPDPVTVSPTPMLTNTPIPTPPYSLDDVLYLTDPVIDFSADSFEDLVNGFDTSIVNTSAFAFVSTCFNLVFNFFNNMGFPGWIYIFLSICLLSFVLGHGHE